MTVVTFEDYTPSPRFDGTAWFELDIFEAADSGGPWTKIDTIAFATLDPDPSDPQTRSFTTRFATLDHGWYYIVFRDATGANEQPTEPVFNGPVIEYESQVDKVARILMARTRDADGNLLGTFNEDTTPEGSEVQQIISDVVRELASIVGSDIPDTLIPEAERLTALRTAMQIELSYYPEQVAAQKSPYEELRQLWLDAVGTPEDPGWFVNTVRSVEGGGEEGGQPLAQFHFPPTTVMRW